MLLSLGMIFLVGLSMAAICARIRFPRILGVSLTEALIMGSVLAAVTAIVITAPLGAFGMDLTYRHLLLQEVEEN